MIWFCCTHNTMTLELAHLNGMHSFSNVVNVSITHMIFLLGQTKRSAGKKVSSFLYLCFQESLVKLINALKKYFNIAIHHAAIFSLQTWQWWTWWKLRWDTQIKWKLPSRHVLRYMKILMVWILISVKYVFFLLW